MDCVCHSQRQKEPSREKVHRNIFFKADSEAASLPVKCPLLTQLSEVNDAADVEEHSTNCNK